MSASLIPNIRFRWFDANGNPLSGGLVYSYISGTSTPANTYSDEPGTIPNTNPVVLDSAGYAAIYLDDSISYRIVVKSSAGVTIQDVSNVTGTSPTVSASTVVDETVTATQGQTLIPFTLSYAPGSGALQVSLNGAVQVLGTDYSETTANSITFATGLNAGDVVYLRNFSTSVFTAPNASVVPYNEGGTGAADRFVADKLQESISVKDFGTVGNGVADDTAAITAAFTAAALTGAELVFVPGTYYITSSLNFTCPVRMLPGSQLKVTNSALYLKFSAGFQSPLLYCLDTDGPTQFLGIQYIYPQWFGSCGGAAEDSSVALTRAFRACRACFNAGSDLTDKTLGARTVWFISGTYRVANVVVYAGTNIDGDWGGSPYGPSIYQIKYDNPGLRFVPKNYALDGTPINTSVGQNYITNVRLGTELPSSTFDGEPMCYFMSPTQATTYLNIAGDNAGGDVGHVDTQFQSVWFKNGNPCIVCDDGMLIVHIRDCTFDVVYRGVHHKGTSKGIVRSYNNVYYGCIRGAIANESSNATFGVLWDIEGDEFKAGQTASGTTAWRRALQYEPTVQVAGSYARVKNCTFLKQTSLGFRVGGPLFFKNVDTVDITGLMMKSPDCTNVQKAIAIQDGVIHCRIQGLIFSDDLADYTNATLIQFSQATQTLLDARLDVSLVNTSATPIPYAVSSNYVNTNTDLTGTIVRGAFGANLNANVTDATGYKYVGSATYNPPSIAAGATTTTTVTVTGAAFGMLTTATFGASLGGLNVTSYVSAPSTVTVVFTNPTGAPIDLASNTLRCTAEYVA